ncbi:MAG: saccharopine dehydrogenase NADP-binding domain-containing protein [Pseudomonadota bacterium]
MAVGREFDTIVYGASGFTGRLVAEYLQNRYGNGGDVKWAMAGRSADKLAAVRDEMGLPDDTPLVTANSDEPESLAAMAKRANVVITTVGPYQLYGSDLVAACVETGTDYVDLCGEPLWMLNMIEAHKTKAQETGARIVHSCGFDSIPSDLGVLKVQNEAKARFGAPVPRVKGRVRGMNGTFSGGTAASFKTSMAAVQKDPTLIPKMMDPFVLSEGKRGPDQPTGMDVELDPAIDMWVGPFVMAAINTKNVHRSNALLGSAYGTDFVYDEMMVTGPGDQGKAIADSLGQMNASIGTTDLKPGEGPSKEEREAGNYDILFIGEAADGKDIRVGVTGDKDPGYGSTSKMLAEAALCLTKDCADTPGGVWTPASAMGEKLIERLVANAGLTFDVEN